LKPKLELNRTDRRRAADVENVNGPGLDTRGTHDRCHSLGKVLHVAVTFGVEGNLLLIAHVCDFLTGIFRDVCRLRSVTLVEKQSRTRARAFVMPAATLVWSPGAWRA